MALSAAKAEVLRLGARVETMVERSLEPLLHDAPGALDEIRSSERAVDKSHDEIVAYLREIGARDLSTERVEESFQMLQTVTELEQISDVLYRRLVPLCEKLRDSGEQLSEAGRQELEAYHHKTVKQVHRALTVFDSVNLEAARSVARKYQKYRLLAGDLQRTHFERLQEGRPRTVATSGLHLDVLDAFKRVASHATNIARHLFESTGAQDAALGTTEQDDLSAAAEATP
jgi:phosphate:Na+ symporter